MGKPSVVKPILIEGKDDYEKTKERWHILKEYFDSKNIEYKEVLVKSNSILSKVVYLIYLLDFASIYRSIFSEVDPTPIESIDFIKKRL